jgi:predicted PurR-regulated permease PerM
LFVFVLALFVSLLISPLVRVLERYGKGRLPHAMAVAAAFLIVIVAVTAGVALVGPTISEQGSQLVERLPALAASVHSVQQVPLPTILEPWRDRLASVVRQLTTGATASALPFASSVVQSILGAATNIVYVVIIPILSFLFLKDGPSLSQAGWRPVGPGNWPRIAKVIADVHQVLGHYVRALGSLSLVTFVIYGGFFVFVGVPFGILLAALAALLEFIPVIGPLTAAGIALLVALVAGFDNLLWLAAFFVAYRLFQDYILAPRLMSSGVGLSPALVIFGFLAGEQIAGIPGMFLAVPIVATLRIIVRSIEPADSARSS